MTEVLYFKFLIYCYSQRYYKILEKMLCKVLPRWWNKNLKKSKAKKDKAPFQPFVFKHENTHVWFFKVVTNDITA